ncbi:MAG TPA: hypothetical protein PLU22_00705 [Polyangiaceae bacterium]|nr:hypothetical protein [Polyangiaceae bacterium]
MDTRSAIANASLFIAALALAAGPAAAQPEDDASASDEGEEASDEGDEASDDEPDEAASGDRKEAARSNSAEMSDEASAGSATTDDASPVELMGKNYFFVGARYRALLVPKFIPKMFADGGLTVAVHAFGPEFAVRKDGFEIVLSPWFANYRMKPTPFKAKDDPENAWEIAESKMKVLYLTGDFLWSHELSPVVAINFGIGAGFGVVFGKLYRQQAFPPVGASGPEDYEPCPANAAGTGPAPGAHPWCGTDNDHYADYDEPSWANGGSKPNLYPWLAIPQLGLRIKPHRHFVARLDAGFGTSGFFFGLGADYGL